MPEDSEFVGHIACPHCGSSDANSLYTDGHAFCFACQTHTTAAGDAQPRRARQLDYDFLDGEFQALLKRKIDEDTCRKFGYKVGKDHRGRNVQIAEYRDADGTLVMQKVRGADKTFTVIGDGKNAPLFGAHLWAAGGRRVVVTEGEIDALSVSQTFGNRWPVVSVPNGAQSAKKAVQRSLEWLETFEEVVFAFDMDEPGREAAVECAALLTPGRAKIAEMPLKDANEMLVADLDGEIKSAIYQARTYRPDGIVGLADIEDRVLAKVGLGFSYPWPTVTKDTFGRFPGDVVVLGAGTGVGKSDFLLQCIAHDVTELGLTVGALFLEQDVGDTGRRLAGKIAARRFNVDDGSWGPEELTAAWEALKATKRVHLYDSFGVADWATIKTKVAYMASSLGCQVIVLDHLTALAAAADDERKELEQITAELAGMAKRFGVVLMVVSHLATPEGTPHEEGGRVMIRHLKGSRSIGFWAHSIFALERKQQAEDQEERHTSTLRCLKDRRTGSATGKTWKLRYDERTGVLKEVSAGSSHGFRDEEAGGGDF